MMFLVKCPQCKHDMKYQTEGKFLSGKRKRCVYCGKSFLVKDRLVKKII